jgi:hypothetical protein
MATLPGVTAVGGISKLPPQATTTSGACKPLSGPLANTDRSWTGAQNRVVSGTYFAAVGIQLLDGRLFDEALTTHPPRRVSSVERGRAVVSRRASRGPVDHYRQSPKEIIGVVADVAVDPKGEWTRMCTTRTASSRAIATGRSRRSFVRTGSLDALQGDASASWRRSIRSS